MPDNLPVVSPAVPPTNPPPAAPAAPPRADSDDFRQDVVDWMGSIDERVDALGRATKALIDSSVAALSPGAGVTPPAAPPAAPTTTVQATGAVAAEAVKSAKRKIGLLW